MANVNNLVQSCADGQIKHKSLRFIYFLYYQNQIYLHFFVKSINAWLSTGGGQVMFSHNVEEIKFKSESTLLAIHYWPDYLIMCHIIIINKHLVGISKHTM